MKQNLQSLKKTLPFISTTNPRTESSALSITGMSIKGTDIEIYISYDKEPAFILTNSTPNYKEMNKHIYVMLLGIGFGHLDLFWLKRITDNPVARGIGRRALTTLLSTWVKQIWPDDIRVTNRLWAADYISINCRYARTTNDAPASHFSLSVGTITLLKVEKQIPELSSSIRGMFEINEPYSTNLVNKLITLRNTIHSHGKRSIVCKTIL